MEYVVKIPMGACYDYTLEEMRREFEAGKLAPESKVRREDSQQWVPIRVALGLDPAEEAELPPAAAREPARPSGFGNPDYVKGCVTGGVLGLILAAVCLMLLLKACDRV